MKHLFRKSNAESPAEEFTGDPVAEARAVVVKLAEIELAHYQRARAIEAEITAARAAGGAAVVAAELAGDPIPEVGRHLAELAGKHESELLGATAAHAQRRNAILAFYGAQARELREQAEGLRDESAKVKLASDKLLLQLKGVEGCDFVPFSKLLVCQLASGAQFADNTRAGVEREIGNTWPKSELLATRADMLSRQANDLEQQAVPDSGAVSAGSVDALVAAVLADPLTLGPGLQSIAEWTEGRERTIREIHPRAVGVRLMLVWRRSEITDRSEASAVLDPNIGRTVAKPSPVAAWDEILAAMPGNRARA